MTPRQWLATAFTGLICVGILAFGWFHQQPHDLDADENELTQRMRRAGY